MRIEGRVAVVTGSGIGRALEMYRGKGTDYDRWISGMRKYQRALGG